MSKITTGTIVDILFGAKREQQTDPASSRLCLMLDEGDGTYIYQLNQPTFGQFVKVYGEKMKDWFGQTVQVARRHEDGKEKVKLTPLVRW